MPIDWNALLQNPDFFLFPIFATMGFIVLGSVVAIQWRKAQQAKYDAYLKQRLVESGFAADEIRSIVNSGASRRRSERMPKMPARCEPSVC